jgi:Na+/proline symporter
MFWGAVQIAVALAAQWMDRSVLDAGLAVLSLAAGPVLGAFLVGVLNRSVGAAAMLAGMAAGTIVLFVIWWTGATAWTWYAFIGAAVTALTALAISLSTGGGDSGLLRRRSDRVVRDRP